MAEEIQVKQETTGPELEVASSTDNAPVAVKKVELDLDDAPFLQAEEKTPAKTEAVEELEDKSEDEEKRKRKKKLILLLSAIGAGVLLVACAAIWWFFFRTPPPLPPTAPEPEVIVVPSTPAPVGDQEIVREFAPFIIPTVDPNGKTGFLICKFSAISKDQAVNQEVQQQLLPLRDAIYYYLRSKENAFLLDARNGEEIRHDLLSVFNDYLTQGKLEDIVFESYLSW